MEDRHVEPVSHIPFFRALPSRKGGSMFSPRRMVVVLAGFALVSLLRFLDPGSIQGQLAVPVRPWNGGPIGAGAPTDCPTDPSLRKTIEAIEDEIADSDWKTATFNLQKLLDLP